MTESTMAAIETLAKADPESNPQIVLALRKACNPSLKTGKMINARQAMEILSITRPTLRKLARSGKLHEIKPTPRKTRFFLDEVNALAFGQN